MEMVASSRAIVPSYEGGLNSVKVTYISLMCGANTAGYFSIRSVNVMKHWV